MCLKSPERVAVLWEEPDTDCAIVGYQVDWQYDVLWSPEEGSDTVNVTEVQQINSLAIEPFIFYTNYSVRIRTTVAPGILGDQFGVCYVVSPEGGKL